MVNKSTLILGVSINKIRYSNKAVNKLFNSSCKVLIVFCTFLDAVETSLPTPLAYSVAVVPAVVALTLFESTVFSAATLASSLGNSCPDSSG